MTLLLPTKFNLPPIPGGMVPRPKLMEQLDESVTHRLTLISAPAGKSLLVGAWAHSRRYRGMPFGWLSLDQGDNDPLLFLEYLLACLEEWGTAIDAALLSRKISEGAQLQEILSDFVREIINIKRPVILILDDYNLIHSKEVHFLLETLLYNACPPLHLVLITRTDPPFELARLRVTGQLAELRMEDLRFSTQEAVEFFQKTSGIHLNEADISLLNERTEGWVAGLQMAAISLRGRQDAAAFVAAFAGSHRYVFDFLFEEVLDHQTPQVRDFLLKTSILERLCAPLCDEVAGSKEAAHSLLNTLERNNLFLVPLDDERTWFRYHHLFATLLQKVLLQAHPDLPPELHRRACRWFEGQGLLPEALHHALEAGDMEMSARMVSANLLALIEHAELTPILLRMEAIPRERRVDLPWLQVAHAWGLAYAGQIEKAAVELSLAEKQAHRLAGDEHSRLMGHLLAVRAYLAWSNGNQPEAVSCAEQAASLIPAEEIAVRALNLTTLGNALTQYSFDPRAVEVLEGAALLARQAGQSHVYMMAAGGLAYALIISGSFRRAFEVCEEAVALAEAYQNKSGQKLTASASTYAFLSRVLMEWGEMEKAIQVARKGLALSELWGQADTIMVCLFYLAKVLSLAGDAEGTRQELARARKIALTVSPWHVLNVDVQELEAYLDLGALGSAETSRLIQQKAEAGVNVPAVIIARSLLLQDRPDDVLTLVESILPKLNQHGSYELVRCCALQALAAYRKKELPRAFAFLEQALAMAEPENRLATFVRDGAAMEKLLELALPRTSHPGFVRRVLAVFEARRKYQAEPAPHSEPLIEPLSARELDILGYLKGYLSAVEIASQLVVSVNTVRTHMKSIYGKLGVHGRSEAVRRAVELGLIQKQ